MRVLAVVLAAGASRRMGRSKQLAHLGGRPMLEHVLDAVSRGPVDEVVLALGAGADAILRAADLHGATVFVAPGWAEGMGSVLAETVSATGGGADAVLVALGDQPLVTAALIGRLVQAWREGAGPVVSAAYAGRPGNPKLFDRSVAEALTGLRGGEGARQLLRANPAWEQLVEVADLGSDADVDDEQALAEVERGLQPPICDIPRSGWTKSS